MLDKEIVIVGYSGHGFVTAEAAISMNINLKYYSDLKEKTINPFNLNYLGFEKDNSFQGWNSDYSFVLGIGDNKLRQEIKNLII